MDKVNLQTATNKALQEFLAHYNTLSQQYAQFNSDYQLLHQKLHDSTKSVIQAESEASVLKGQLAAQISDNSKLQRQIEILQQQVHQKDVEIANFKNSMQETNQYLEEAKFAVELVNMTTIFNGLTTETPLFESVMSVPNTDVVTIYEFNHFKEDWCCVDKFVQGNKDLTGDFFRGTVATFLNGLTGEVSSMKKTASVIFPWSLDSPILHCTTEAICCSYLEAKKFDPQNLSFRDKQLFTMLDKLPSDLHPQNTLVYFCGEDRKKQEPIGGIEWFQWFLKLQKGGRTMGHVEFFGLPSCNYLVDAADGLPVMWMIIDRKFLKEVDQLLRTCYNTDITRCNFWINAKILKQKGIPYTIVLQRVGQLVITKNCALHWVMSVGKTNAIAWNVALPVSHIDDVWLEASSWHYSLFIANSKLPLLNEGYSVPYLHLLGILWFKQASSNIGTSIIKTLVSKFSPQMVAAKEAIQLATSGMKIAGKTPEFEQMAPYDLPTTCKKCRIHPFIFMGYSFISTENEEQFPLCASCWIKKPSTDFKLLYSMEDIRFMFITAQTVTKQQNK